MTWKLMIHGGSGAMRPDTISAEQEKLARAGLEAALDAGEGILSGGGGALDAVEAAARLLEDDPMFNAGRGSVLTAEGMIELDAAIMDGRDRRTGERGAGGDGTQPAHPADERRGRRVRRCARARAGRQ
jgi:beta-aspartyl-peptidase (threonine type)